MHDARDFRCPSCGSNLAVVPLGLGPLDTKVPKCAVIHDNPTLQGLVFAILDGENPEYRTFTDGAGRVRIDTVGVERYNTWQQAVGVVLEGIDDREWLDA